MAVKKINQSNDEIDITEILKKWWNFRKLIFLRTLIVSLIISFVLFFSDKTYINKTQQYVTTVIKSDLADKSSLIFAGYKSQSYIVESLKRLSLDIDPNKLLENMIIKESIDPISEDLKKQILSADETKLKSLALTNEELSKIMQDLNDNSKELITIQLYHEALNLSEEQAKNLILSLSKTVNENLILRSSREDNVITIIETNDINENYINSNEQIARLTNIINTSQRNIAEMKLKYNFLLKNYDLEDLSTRVNITQKLLHEISRELGSTFAIDTLNVNIRQKEREIDDLKSSLKFLDSQNINLISSSNQNSNSSDISGSITQLDAKVFDKILSIGSVLSLNSFRLSTVEKIQELQKEKSNLINQKDLLNLPYNSFDQIYNLDNVNKKVIFLAEEINELSNQIRNLVEPKSAFEIIKNPELIKLNSKPITEYLTIILILTSLAFLIISLITILTVAKNHKKN
jgi:AraC-like DNA-binding protein